MNMGIMALVCVLVAGMLLRMPIGFSMLVSGFAYLLVKGQDLGLVAEQVGNGLYNSYVLLAVPLFVFAANIMNAGTVSERIFDFCRILVGRLRGGLAQVDILVSVIFSRVTWQAAAGRNGRSGWPLPWARGASEPSCVIYSCGPSSTESTRPTSPSSDASTTALSGCRQQRSSTNTTR